MTNHIDHTKDIITTHKLDISVHFAFGKLNKNDVIKDVIEHDTIENVFRCYKIDFMDFWR